MCSLSERDIGRIVPVTTAFILAIGLEKVSGSFSCIYGDCRSFHSKVHFSSCRAGRTPLKLLIIIACHFFLFSFVSIYRCITHVGPSFELLYFSGFWYKKPPYKVKDRSLDNEKSILARWCPRKGTTARKGSKRVEKGLPPTIFFAKVVVKLFTRRLNRPPSTNRRLVNSLICQVGPPAADEYSTAVTETRVARWRLFYAYAHRRNTSCAVPQSEFWGKSSGHRTSGVRKPFGRLFRRFWSGRVLRRAQRNFCRSGLPNHSQQPRRKPWRVRCDLSFLRR